jgi:hypothetical protein
MNSLRLFCLAGIFTSALNAGVIFDSINGAMGPLTSGGADPVSVVVPFASFTSGTGEQISDLQLVLSGDNTSLGTVQVGLYADATPGTLITALGTLSDSLLSSSPTTFDIVLNATPLLTADTRYWIGLSGVTSASWSFTDEVSGAGVADESFANVGGTFSNLEGPYQMRITTVDLASPTPEPAAVFMVVAGFGALVLLRRRIA